MNGGKTLDKDGQSAFQGSSRLVRFACVRRGLCKTWKKASIQGCKMCSYRGWSLAKTFMLGDPKNVKKQNPRAAQFWNILKLHVGATENNLKHRPTGIKCSKCVGKTLQAPPESKCESWMMNWHLDTKHHNIIWDVVSIKKCKGLISFIDKTCEFFLTNVFAFLDFWHFLQQASATLDQEENGNLESTAKTCLLQHTASPRINPRAWCDELSLWSRYQGIRVLQGATSETTRSLATGRTGLNGEGKKGGKGSHEGQLHLDKLWAETVWDTVGQYSMHLNTLCMLMTVPSK